MEDSISFYGIIILFLFLALIGFVMFGKEKDDNYCPICGPNCIGKSCKYCQKNAKDLE